MKRGSPYTDGEMMAVAAARELRDGEVVFVGIGLPNLACNLARATHAPNLVLVYESGAVGAAPDRLPASIGDPALVTGCLMVAGMADVFQFLLQGGKVQVGFLGGAQIDRWGNINTTVLGGYGRPAVRLPGAGGASAVAISAQRTLIVSKLSRRAFPETVDFVTSPGMRYPGPGPSVRGRANRRGGDDFGRPGALRSELGMTGAGPVRVITDKCLLELDQESGEMAVSQLYPGATLEGVRAEVGWELRARPALPVAAPPTDRELALLREKLDPEKLYLRG